MKGLLQNVRLVTPAAPDQRGSNFGALRILPTCDVEIVNGLIAAIRVPGSPPTDLPLAHDWVIQGRSRVLLPGFVDCHTHACWAGDRLGEWELKLRGTGYLEILASGGGIMSTVRAVRAASREALAQATLARLQSMKSLGTTTVEIKSGYGLSTDTELKMLGAIADAAADWPGTVISTALLGHAIDNTDPDFVEHTITQTLPAVHDASPQAAIDVFVEHGAWSLADAERLLIAAQTLGHPIRLHADQFNSLGGVPLAIRLGAASVDHLEASTPADLAALGTSETIGVALPICGLHMDGRYANLRAVLDSGGRVAIASNLNPGSAPSASMPLAIATAVRHCGLTFAEALVAATLGGALVLGLPDRGRIDVGLPADLMLLSVTDERELAFQLGMPLIDHVIIGGKVVVWSHADDFNTP